MIEVTHGNAGWVQHTGIEICRLLKRAVSVPEKNADTATACIGYGYVKLFVSVEIGYDCGGWIDTDWIRSGFAKVDGVNCSRRAQRNRQIRNNRQPYTPFTHDTPLSTSLTSMMYSGFEIDSTRDELIVFGKQLSGFNRDHHR